MNSEKFMRIDPRSAAKLRRKLKIAIFLLTAAAIALLIVCIILNAQFKRVRHEAGEVLYATEIVKDDGAYFGSDFDPECTSRPGVYYFTVYGGGRERRVRLNVVDTKAPEITVKNIMFAIEGDLPVPTDFIDTVYEADSFSGEFITEMPEFKAPGKYNMKVRFSDATGNKTKVFDVVMTLIYDTEPPKVTLLGDKSVIVGQSVDYRDMVALSDNCVGKIILEIDDSGVDLIQAGEYYVFFTAKDKSSNISEKVRGLVTVTENALTDESAE